MPDKKRIVDLVGPVAVYPNVEAQQLIRAEEFDLLKKGGDVDSQELQRACALRCRPRQGFVVRKVENTLDVEPGAVFNRTVLQHLIDTTDHIVRIAQPKYEESEKYVDSVDLLESLDLDVGEDE